ncbi:MAG: tol-pal system protein YbgF [Hyphomicrobiales bacterium]
MTRFKTAFLNSVMVAGIAASLTVSVTVAPAAAADGFGSKIASTFGGFFKGEEESKAPVAVAPAPSPRETALLVPAPVPQADLLKDGEQGASIIKVQSKRELGTAININSRAIGENTIRVQELQEQMRQITGRVEQLVFDLQRIQEQLRIMQEDAGVTPEPSLQQRADNSSENDNPDSNGGGDANLIPPPGSVGGSQIAAAPAPSVDAPLDLKPNIGAQANLAETQSRDPLLQPNGTPSLGTLTLPDTDPETLYNFGYSKLLNGDYVGAEENLRKFVQSYPNHQLAPNGRYWLAETFYARGQFADAVEEFSGTYKAFPASTKAPDSLLKLGLSLARLEEHDAACATLAEVFSRFPEASRSIHIAARDEQARSNCI